MAVSVDGRTITLIGTVGVDWWGDYFSHADVVFALSQIGGGDPIKVKINSGGGVATEGAAIHALFKSFDGDVNMVVEGVAASAASLIAMAGTTITMADGAVMMIHDVAAFTFGNSADHQKTIDGLEAMSNSYADIYAERSGKTAAQARKIMKNETWFTPDEAIDAGFADEQTDEKTPLAAAFAYGMYAHAPQQFVALANQNKWSLNEACNRAELPTLETGLNKEKPTMSTKPKKVEDNKVASQESAPVKNVEAPVVNNTASADDVKSRIKEITTSDAAKGRADLAEHFAFDTDLTAKAAIAALEKAPSKQAAAQNQTDDYVAQRTTAAGQVQPQPSGKPKASLSPADIYASRRNAS